MPEIFRPTLPHNFYNDMQFIEELIDITCKSGDGGLFAGQKHTYQENTFLRDLNDLNLDDNAEIGKIRIVQWEARTDWFDNDSRESIKEAVKLHLIIPEDSKILTKLDGKFFLTVPPDDEFWEGKYELKEVRSNSESIEENVGASSILRSNGKKLRTNPSLHFECDNFISASWILTEDSYGDDISPLDIPILKQLADSHQQKAVSEGVLSSDNLVPHHLHNKLGKMVLTLQESQDPKDYHPHSKQIVQDLIHPALFCYVSGESYVPEVFETVMKSYPARNGDDMFHNKSSDLFGRDYEDSKYQWLPTDVSIEMDGRARFLSPVNNLDLDQNKLHDSLEELLTLAIPYFEEVLGFVNRIGPMMHPNEEAAWEVTVKTVTNPPVSLKGKEIQVIPKIVTYHLNPGQMYEGVWHVEGMSHENIIATGLYILDRDENLTGGELMFKRQYTSEEGGHYTSSVPQERNMYASEMILQGYQPLGKVATPKKRFIVFPNSHAHKLTKLQNAGNEHASRTIVVFFLVHPAVTLISTAHVPCQNWTKLRAATKALMEKQLEIWGLAGDQCESSLQEILEFAKWGFTIEEAKKHRIELMKERKYNKQTWNIRQVELCEH